MKHQRSIFAVFTITLLSFGGWFAVLQSIDPTVFGVKGQTLFYAFLAVFLWGLISLINYFIRFRRSENSKKTVIVISMRQGMIISLGIIGLLIFRSLEVLNILSATVYLIALVLIEFYFRNRGASYA